MRNRLELRLFLPLLMLGCASSRTQVPMEDHREPNSIGAMALAASTSSPQANAIGDQEGRCLSAVESVAKPYLENTSKISDGDPDLLKGLCQKISRFTFSPSDWASYTCRSKAGDVIDISAIRRDCLRRGHLSK